MLTYASLLALMGGAIAAFIWFAAEPPRRAAARVAGGICVAFLLIGAVTEIFIRLPEQQRVAEELAREEATRPRQVGDDMCVGIVTTLRGTDPEYFNVLAEDTEAGAYADAIAACIRRAGWVLVRGRHPPMFAYDRFTMPNEHDVAVGVRAPGFRQTAAKELELALSRAGINATTIVVPRGVHPPPHPGELPRNPSDPMQRLSMPGPDPEECIDLVVFGRRAV